VANLARAQVKLGAARAGKRQRKIWQENLARKTWQENLAGKLSQPFAQVVASVEQSLRHGRTIMQAGALEVAQK
jgi:hypothetical protein